jgi:hypothetical protein
MRPRISASVERIAFLPYKVLTGGAGTAGGQATPSSATTFQ